MPLGNFTGKELAHALRLNLDSKELMSTLRKKAGQESLIRRIFKKKLKLFLITFDDDKGQHRGYIMPAEDAYSACVNLVPFFAVIIPPHEDHSSNAHYHQTCPDCIREFDTYATWLNKSKVKFVGWPNELTKNTLLRV